MDIKLNIRLAKTWNELTAIQLSNIALALEHFHKFKDCHPKEFLPAHYSKLYVQLVKNLLRPNNFIKVWIALHQIQPDFYIDDVKFLIEGSERTKFIPAFKVKKELVYPPADRLRNITMKEFSLADSLYYTWKEKDSIGHLNSLCATLYRKKAGNSLTDIRIECHGELIEKEALKFAKVPLKTKLAIAYTYEGCRAHISRSHPNVFPQSAPLSEEEKLKPRPKPKYVPFGKLMSAKAEYKPHQLTETENLNVYKFLSLFDNELAELKTRKK